MMNDECEGPERLWGCSGPSGFVLLRYSKVSKSAYFCGQNATAMNAQPMVSEILDTAARLGAEDFENLFKRLAILRVQRNHVPSMSKAEAGLLEQINVGFPAERWERLQFLDSRLEDGGLSEQEAAESLRLAEDYEGYTVHRLQLLVKLAALRNVSLDEVMAQLKIAPLAHG
jgi:hypothetical protein